MTDQHSDDMTAAAVQARVWDVLTARTRAAFDLAVRDRSVHSLERLQALVSAMRHQVVAARLP